MSRVVTVLTLALALSLLGGSLGAPLHAAPTTYSIQVRLLANGAEANLPPGPVVPVGTPILWTYLVINNGRGPLRSVAVSDDQGATITCPKAALAAGESTVCTAVGAAASGLHRVLATARAVTQASGVVPAGRPVSDQDPAHYRGVRAAVTLEKRTQGEDADAPPGPWLAVGSPVTWTYAVANTGDVRLSGLVVTDDQGVAVVCPQTALEPGQTMTCRASGVALVGPYGNVGTVTGKTPLGWTVEASDPSHYLGAQTTLWLHTLTDGEEWSVAPGPDVPVGDTLARRYVVVNTGDLAVSSLVLSDPSAPAGVTCPAAELAPGAGMVCRGESVALGGANPLVATVAGSTASGWPVAATATDYYVGVLAAVTLEKRTQGEDADTPPGPVVAAGTTVQWSYLVANTGEARLVDLAVVDDHGVVVMCPKTVLEPDESMTCTGSGTAVEGPYGNVGTVTGRTPLDWPVAASDPSHYTGVVGGVSLETMVNGQSADVAPGPSITVGSSVQWTFLTTNSGGLNLSQVTVTDDQGLVVTCPKTELMPGESMTCTALETATVGAHAHIGSVAASLPGSGSVSANDPGHYQGVAANQGCTPGYWHNHASSWPATGYAPSQTVGSVFSNASRYPYIAATALFDAVAFDGGSGDAGAAEIVVRAGVAALLNASHPSVHYPRTSSAVITDVNTALNGTRDQMLTLAASLDADNNRGCPLN